ncbi:hypothetical protein XGA_4170 [Xanthomonas hortorum ATCC 19865]|nr:hypothetical protein XGA_4170 [Xanthomonas hortorum ATCC 19865]
MAQHLHLLAETVAARFEVPAEQRIFHRAVAARHAQQQTPLANVLNAGCRLQCQYWLSQRQHHRSSAKQNAVGYASQIAEIGEDLEHLGGIAKAGVVNRHVAQPEGAKSQAIGQAYQFTVTLYGRNTEGAPVFLAASFSRRRPIIVEWQLHSDRKSAFGQSSK